MKSLNEKEFVSVDIDEDDDVPASTNKAISNGEVSMESTSTQVEGNMSSKRSMLKILWTEATSTTAFPQLHQQLHHRHGVTTTANSTGSLNREDSMSSNCSLPRRTSSNIKHKKHSHNYTSRAARIAKRVWLSAFAALIASVLIAVHIFLFRVLFRTRDMDTVGNSENSENNVVPSFIHLAAEDRQVAMTLKEAHAHTLTPITIHPIDTAQYTIRMNTWHRNEQLLISINHHSQCEGVKEIQVIWCDTQNEPPNEIIHHKSGKIKIEKHVVNSLNERFKVLLDPPTLGILSLDDDVLRPCQALDAAFIRWTRHPDRMLGFDVRTHVVDESDEEKKWKYGYMSTTEASNRYSLTLPRASFLHRDYLDLYTMALPRPMYAYIAEHFECEDIAMSFFVSSLTEGKPPLITDYWSVKSMVKLYSEERISGGKDHKKARDKCVNDFAEMLGLKGNGVIDGVHVRPLQTGKIKHKDMFFGYGAEPEDWSSIDPQSFKSQHLQDLIKMMQRLKSMSGTERMTWLAERRMETMNEAKQAGMIENTEEWKNRWRSTR